MKKLIFMDCESWGPCPTMGGLTEFGAVEFISRETFHGVLAPSIPDPNEPRRFLPVGVATPEKYNEVFSAFRDWMNKFGKDRPLFVSDNPAWDFQWINDGFFRSIGWNPFGHSARRIGDFYAGLTGQFNNSTKWKRLRVTPHDHNPVNDAMGNVEAFARMLKGER